MPPPVSLSPSALQPITNAGDLPAIDPWHSPSSMSCSDEMAYEARKDEMFAQLDSLPTPFPVEAPNVTLQTPPTCFRLKDGSPRVLFAIESFKQVEMVRRVVTRLEHPSHGFLLHTSSDVDGPHCLSMEDAVTWVHTVMGGGDCPSE